jgi:hypothetical protein
MKSPTFNGLVSAQHEGIDCLAVVAVALAMLGSVGGKLSRWWVKTSQMSLALLGLQGNSIYFDYCWHRTCFRGSFHALASYGAIYGLDQITSTCKVEVLLPDIRLYIFLYHVELIVLCNFGLRSSFSRLRLVEIWTFFGVNFGLIFCVNFEDM